jgi:hypothetical protein
VTQPVTTPGTRTTDHWRVGKQHRVLWNPDDQRMGVCVSVTYWGSKQVRWVRLLFEDGTEKSYSPRELRVPRAW